MTKQEINEIIFRGMGYVPHARNTAFWVKEADKNGLMEGVFGKDYLYLPDFFTWPGFGMMMEWWEQNPSIFHANIEKKEHASYSGFVRGLHHFHCGTWPELAAETLASHFHGSPVSLNEGGDV
jgi:hypothetical protein